MQLSAFTVLYKDRPLSDVLDIFKAKGITHAEVGSGGFIGKDHCDPARLLANEGERKKFQELFSRQGHEDFQLKLPWESCSPTEKPG